MEDVSKLSIPLEKICYIIAKARQFDAKDVVTDPDPGSNASDDDMRAILEDHSNDPVHAELASAIWALNEDEQIDLVTLVWLGRDDAGVERWDDLRTEATRLHNDRTGSYVLGIPLLGDYLDEAISKFGLSCEDLEER